MVYTRVTQIVLSCSSFRYRFNKLFICRIIHFPIFYHRVHNILVLQTINNSEIHYTDYIDSLVNVCISIIFPLSFDNIYILKSKNNNNCQLLLLFRRFHHKHLFLVILYSNINSTIYHLLPNHKNILLQKRLRYMHSAQILNCMF